MKAARRLRGAVQQKFQFRTWGGFRPGSGRPIRDPLGRRRPFHGRRERSARSYPVHVVLRFDLPRGENLRRDGPHFWLRQSLGRMLRRRSDFGVVVYSLQHNHVHLIVEADSPEALQSGLHGLCVSVARRLNRGLGRRGRLFAERHFRVVLKCPGQVRNALAYVLLNRRHHIAQVRGRLDPPGLDPFSSGRWFDGWETSVLGTPVAGACVVCAPRTWLCRTGWRQHHALIALEEVPG